MVSVKSHRYEGRCLSIEFDGAAPGVPYPLRSLGVAPTLEAAFEGEEIRRAYAVYAPAHFNAEGRLTEEWTEGGEAAEAQGPFILDSQEFTLKGLLEYLYRWHTNAT